MFRNKKLYIELVKYSKLKNAKKSDDWFYFSRVMALSINSQKNWFFDPTKIKGFHSLSLLSRKLPQLRTIKKFMSGQSIEKCWHCKKPLEVIDFNCASCGYLQRPKQNVNYFELLGVSQMFDLNLDDLTRKFRNLQMIFHPDKFANKSEEELEISESYSRLLNSAYSTLKDPVERGFYILKFLKVPQDDLPLKQEFLVTMMEKNEELEFITKQNSLLNFQKNNSKEMENQIKLIKEAFNSNDLYNAKLNLIKLKYLMSLDQKIKEKHNELINIKR